MSETMNRGASLMVIHGSTLRHERLGMTHTMPLGCQFDFHEPATIDHEHFAGLVRLGITRMEAHGNSIAVQTKTGMNARLPFLPDPHHDTVIRPPTSAETVHPSMFTEWTKAVRTVTLAIGSDTAFTYRSSVFAHTRSTIAVSRLARAWPTPCVTGTAQLSGIRSRIGDTVPDKLLANKTQIYVRASGQDILVETPDAPMSQAAVDLLALLSPHTQTAVIKVNAHALSAAVQQIDLAHKAASPKVGKSGVPEAGLTCSTEALKIITSNANILLPTTQAPGLPPIGTLPRLNVPLSALLMLVNASDLAQEAEITGWQSTPGDSHIMVRCGATSFIAAAREE